MRNLLLIVLTCFVGACASPNKTSQTRSQIDNNQAEQTLNILIMSEDRHKQSFSNKSAIVKRATGRLSEQMNELGFDVFDETAITLANYEQGRSRRSDAELIDIARSVKRPPIDVLVLFSIYATKHEREYTTKLKASIEGRLINVQTGRSLGSFDVESKQAWNVGKNCERPCILKHVGKGISKLSNELGFVLAEKLAHQSANPSKQEYLAQEIGGDSATLSNENNHANNLVSVNTEAKPKTIKRESTKQKRSAFVTEYQLIFDGFNAEDYSNIEEYLLMFSGYKSHRLIESYASYKDIWYKSSIGSAKLSRNLHKMLEHLGIRAIVNVNGNTYKVKKITRRGKNRRSAVVF